MITDSRIIYVTFTVQISSGISQSFQISTIKSIRIPGNSQTSSRRLHLETVPNERRRPSFAGPLSKPFPFRHVQPAMIRLLDLVPFGPVRPSSLCHCFYYYLPIQSPPNLGKQARPVSSLESWAPRCPGTGWRPDLSLLSPETQYHHPAEILLHSCCPKRECPCGRANRRPVTPCR